MRDDDLRDEDVLACELPCDVERPTDRAEAAAPDDLAAVTPQDVYRALSPTMAQALHQHCKLCKETPAAVLADALALHLDELAGAIHDPTIIELVAVAQGAAS